MASRDAQLSVRVPRRIHEALAVQATAERRTIADVVNNLLEERYPAATKKRSATR